MNSKRWWLMAIAIVGCGAGVATMVVTLPTKTFFSSTNRMGVITVEGNDDFAINVVHGVRDPELGYPYVVENIVVDDLPTGTYTGTLSIVAIIDGENGNTSTPIGHCTIVVDAENQTFNVDWFDGSLPPNGP